MTTFDARAIPETVCAEFRTWMAEVGAPTGKTIEQVYKLWHDYCVTCQNYDQSPVKFEFLEWYKADLTPGPRRIPTGFISDEAWSQ